jgi:hypothetical protein
VSEYIYDYHACLLHRGKQTSVVTQGRREFVEKFIRQTEFGRLFGGYIVSRASQSEQEYLGVWGARTASRFRRLLRERGASFAIERYETAPFRPKIISVIHRPDESTKGG